MTELFLATTAVVVCAAVWPVIRKPPAVFAVRVRRGRVELVKGRAMPAFVAAVGEVCREADTLDGEVRGVRLGRRTGLWFSSGIPPGARQRLRNWWVSAGAGR